MAVHEDPDRQVHHLRVLLEVTEALAREVALDRLLQVIMAKTTEVLDADRSTLFLYDASREELWSLIAQGLGTREIRIPADLGLTGYVAQTREVVNLADAYEDARFNRRIDRETGYRTRSMLCMPVENAEGTLIGVIQVLNKKEGLFTDVDERLLAGLAAHAAVAIERARLVDQLMLQQRLERDLEVAREIQVGLLPGTVPDDPAEPRYRLAARMEPATEVGGDFYDFFMLDGHRLALAIGDVSGKGVSAALFMGVTRTLLRATARHGLAPDICMEFVNSTLAAQNPADMFVTLFYGILNLETGVLAYCNAGHCSPCLLHNDGSVVVLEQTNGVPVCAVEGYPYDARQIQLAPGEHLLFYSDGVTETMDLDDQLFGEARLQKALQHRRETTPEETVARVFEAVDAFRGTVPPWDDITVMAVCYQGRPAPEADPRAGQ